MIIESLDVLKAQRQLDLLRIYQQLTLPLDFDTIISKPTTERQHHGNTTSNRLFK
jgi:hypothetical protein